MAQTSRLCHMYKGDLKKRNSRNHKFKIATKKRRATEIGKKTPCSSVPPWQIIYFGFPDDI